jgi:Flp pilus assembly protein TadG
MRLHRNLRNRARAISRAATRVVGLRGEEGGALLEMAITMPFMMLLLTGAASFSLTFYNLQALGNATSNAVQLIAGQSGVISDPCDQAMTTVQASLSGWTTANLSYSLTATNASGTTTTYTGSASSFTCAAAGPGTATTPSTQAANEPMILTVKYTNTWYSIFNWGPGAGNAGWSLSPPSSISSTQAAMAD